MTLAWCERMHRMTTSLRRALVGALVVTMQLTPVEAGTSPLTGRWGGDRLNLVIDADGARVESDCARGMFAGPINLSASGTFLATGTFETYRAGPQRADEVSAVAIARYAAEVKGDAMQLSILPAGASALQVFNLRKGASVKLVRCL